MVPHCVADMTSLKAIWIDVCPDLTDIPLSMFKMPNLLELSLFTGSISYESLIEYNVPEEMQNDTDAVDQWFEENFAFNLNQTDYWFDGHPLCDSDDRSALPGSLQSMLNVTCGSLNCSSAGIAFCPPRKQGDGRCDAECAINLCDDDSCSETLCDWDYGVFCPLC